MTQDRTHIHVVTWNIHKCIGGVDRRYRPERVIDTLAHYTPDLLFLQEVDEGARRSRYHRQVDMIGDALGLPYRFYGPTHRLLTRGHYGNAIISRWPLTHQCHLDLTIGRRRRRGALCARVRVPLQSAKGRRRHRRSLWLVNMHLGLAGSERHAQLQRFLQSAAFRKWHTRTPVVLGGDLNDLWGSLLNKALEPAGFQRAGKRFNTFPAVAPLRPLDLIALRGDVDAKRYFAARASAAQQASDHLPVKAELVLRGGRSKHRPA